MLGKKRKKEMRSFWQFKEFQFAESKSYCVLWELWFYYPLNDDPSAYPFFDSCRQWTGEEELCFRWPEIIRVSTHALIPY